MVDSQTCVNCGKKAPETDTNYTLISAQFGWRLTRFKGADGSLVLEWRCPSCWREYKQRTRPAATTPNPGASSTPPSSQPRSSSSSLPGSSPPVSTGSGAPASPGSGPPRGSRRTPR